MLTENLRNITLKRLFNTGSFSKAWSTWKPQILKHLGNEMTSETILNLGDELREIFKSTKSIKENKSKSEQQSEKASAGHSFEALVSWYLNLCLKNSRAFVTKFHKDLVPQSIQDALTITYGNFKNTSETDLIGFVLPDNDDYLKKICKTEKDTYKIFDEFAQKEFSKFQVSVIQLKVNWNDVAQVPFLYNILYRLGGVVQDNVQVGVNSWNTNSLHRFSYSFVTVPSQGNLDEFKNSSVAVQRVSGLSGGNYWCAQTKDGVANSIQEMPSRIFGSGFVNNNVRDQINENCKDLNCYKLFNI